MSEHEWRLIAPDEMAAVAIAVQAFQAALPPSFVPPLVLIDGIGVIWPEEIQDRLDATSSLGQCPSCGTGRNVDRVGLIGVHNFERDGALLRCSGSRQPPLESPLWPRSDESSRVEPHTFRRSGEGPVPADELEKLLKRRPL